MVEFNAMAPSKAEQEALRKAIDSVKPYSLQNLDAPREEIERIYQRMLADMANYKNISVPTVETHNTSVTRTVFQRQAKIMTVTKRDGCKLSVKFPGISYCHPNKYKEDVPVEVDEPVQVTEQQERPVVVQKQEQILRNEVDYYWQLAVEEYEKNMQPERTNS